MDIVKKSIGSLALDLSFAGGMLTLSAGDAAIGLAVSVSVSEAQLLAAGLKLVPAGVASEVAGAVVSVVEAATVNL